MVVTPSFYKCESAQMAEVAMMDVEEAENKTEVGATVDAMSAMLASTVKMKTLVN